MTPRCHNCPARDYHAMSPEPARGGSPRLAIVGEAPGKREILGSGSGMLQRGLRRELGLAPSDCHWTNATLCQPPERLQQACVQACAGRLRAELLAASPRVIVAAGSWGVSSLMYQGRKRTPIQKWRGSVSHIDLSTVEQPPRVVGSGRKRKRSAGASPEAVTECAEPGSSVETAAKTPSAAVSALLMPVMHPSFVMPGRNPLWGELLELDLERVGRYLEKPFVAPEDAPGRVTTVARTEDELEALLGALGDHIGNDVETVGLGPTRTNLVCLALSDGTATVVVPWSQGRNGLDPYWLRPERIAGLLSECLAERLSITHNGPFFDFIVESRYGIHVRQWDDTLLMSHALRSHEPRNLFHVVSRGLDVPPWKCLENRTASIERLYGYNAQDSLYSQLIWRKLHAELTAA